MDTPEIVETPVSPRRRPRRTKTDIIKEAYLPYIFLMAAAVIIIIFIIGALIRSGT